jgi:hypothetical protein
MFDYTCSMIPFTEQVPAFLARGSDRPLNTRREARLASPRDPTGSSATELGTSLTAWTA